MSADATPSTGTYLDRIVPLVRRRLEQRRGALPVEALLDRLPTGVPPSFAAALATPGMSLIAEVKRASPSRGPIRPDLDVASLVRHYELAGARAVSVLTEEDFFQGSLADLRVASAATGLPVLRKDFILDEYQIYEARAAGASAVLLIASLLSDDEVGGLVALARGLSLDVLLEVHDEVEARRALAFPDVIIGINNRDLRTFEVSLQTTVDLARLVPRERLLVGESGISDPEEVRMLARAGVDAVLVGEALLRDNDITWAVRRLVDAAPSAEVES